MELKKGKMAGAKYWRVVQLLPSKKKRGSLAHPRWLALRKPLACPRTAASPPEGASIADGTAVLMAAGACDFLEGLGWLGGISKRGFKIPRGTQLEGECGLCGTVGVWWVETYTIKNRRAKQL